MPTILPTIASSMMSSVCGGEAQPRPTDLAALQRECRELDRSTGWGAGSGHVMFGRRAQMSAARCWADFNAATGLQAKGVAVETPKPLGGLRRQYEPY